MGIKKLHIFLFTSILLCCVLLFPVYSEAEDDVKEPPTAIKCVENSRDATFPNAEYARCIECDVCGYCFSQPERGLDMPDDWNECAKCLYRDVFKNIGGINGGIDDIDKLTNEDALRNLTLHIEGDVEGIPKAPQPKKGRYYTQLGCFSTNGEDYFDAFTGGVNSGAGGPVAQILRILFSVVGSLAFLYLLYGAFVMMTAQGRAEKIQEGKGIITGSIVGVLFSLSAVFIVNIITNEVLRVPMGQAAVEVGYKEKKNSDDKIMTVKPKKIEFNIVEVHYSGTDVSCTSGMSKLGPKSTGNNKEKMVICYHDDYSTFTGASPIDVLNVPKDTDIRKIIIDGKIEL